MVEKNTLPAFYRCEKLFEKVFKHQKPLLSACVLSYEQSDTVIKSVEALLNQGDCSYEILIVDDASRKETCKKMLDYLRTVDRSDATRIALWRAEENCEALRNRLRAMQLAAGDWFVSVDGDDLSMSDRMPRLAHLVKDLDNQIMLVSTNGLVWNGSATLPESASGAATALGPPASFGVKVVSLADYKDIVARTPVGGCGFVVRREMFERFKEVDTPYRIKGDDVVLSKRALLLGKILIDYSYYYYYYVHPESACGSGCYNKRWMKDRIDRCDILLNDVAHVSEDGKVPRDLRKRILREKHIQELDYKAIDCSFWLWPFYWIPLCILSRSAALVALKHRVKLILSMKRND